MRIFGKAFTLNSASIFVAGPLLGIPLLGALLLLAGPSDAAGQVITDWQGSGKGKGGRWNTSGNWTGTVPNASTVARFSSSGSGATSIEVDTTASALGLIFTNTAIARNFVAYGDSLTIGSSGIVSSSANLQTFSVPITLSGSQSWSGGPLTFDGTISLGANTLTLAPGASRTFNMNTVISGTGGMTVNGAGTVLLNATATFSGATRIEAGTLRINAANRLATSTAMTVNGGTFDMNGNSQTVGSLSGTGGTVALGSGTLTTNTAGASVYSGAISGTGGVTQSGSGTQTLAGANTYSGSTVVTAGTLNVQHASALGSTAAGTSVVSGATLSMTGGVTVTGESLTITGSGTSGSGALRNVSGTNTWDGQVTLGGNTTVTAVGGTLNVGFHPALLSSVESDTLNIGTNTLTVNTDGGHMNIASIIDGTTGGIVKQGSGILTLSGLHNTYTGTTSVENGFLFLNTLSFNFPAGGFVYVNQGLQGNVVIGDNIGTAGTASMWYAGFGGDKIADTVNIRVNSDGLLNLNGTSDIIGSLTLQGGDVATGVGTLGIAGDIDVLASAREASISGFVSLNSGVRTFDVEAGASLRVDATMNDGGFIKTGVGTMIVTSNNASTYAGSTTVDAGVLNVRANNALGQGNGSSAASGTEVNTGAALELQGGITIANERLTLGSTGIGNAGGLRNISGDNTFSGTINLDGASRINSDAGTLTLDGNTLAMTTHSLTVGGAGNTNISRAISSDIASFGTLTKDGTGTLSLSGNSTYRGATEINSGVVKLGSNFGLGSSAGATTVANGAALHLEGSITSGENISFQGTGSGGSGAIRNLSGDNTLSGALTLSGAGRINSDAGSLTVSGNIGGSGQALTIGGSGNTTISGVIATGAGTLTKDGSGMLTLSGANTFTGLTTVSQGTLDLGATNIFGSSNFVTTATGSVVDMNGFDQTLGGVTGTGTLVFDGGDLTLTGASTFAGVFSGEGTVTINAGASLTLGADFDNSSLNIILNGGTLFVGNQSSTFGSLTVESSSIIDFGDSYSIIEFTNGVTANALLQVQNWVETVDYFYSTLNAGVQGTAPLNNIVFTGFIGDNTQWLPYTDGPYNNHQITPVPEPSVYGAGLMTSLLGLMLWRRRRQRARQG